MNDALDYLHRLFPVQSPGTAAVRQDLQTKVPEFRVPFSNGFETRVQQDVLTFLLGALSADLPSCPQAPPGHKGSTCPVSNRCDSALSDAAYPLTVYAQEAHKRPVMPSPHL